ncbi:acyl-CoA dehydrogenase domain protein [Reticulomyxa filosa]|uniref:Acyl-CoA dehydrogenase domain protein n=1 Tax=Reticulomyxa filosa TaxID=46433 RepID=X6M5R9_RETFI|nr:acyl-CoA dehydrogenase domain protein [Reticulomyxa filosa]|eukprot:ETO09274.1 acyl-CoA dehydrogenase domain protein [Reticulomyxa filosa]
MGKTDRDAPVYLQQSMFVVEMNTPGIRIARHLTVFGYDDNPHGHCEVIFDNVKVPKENLIKGEGMGFEIAQGRLGPGRIHHCMRLIGMSERALHLMKNRALTRQTFGKATANHSNIRQDIAVSRMEIEQARLLTLQAAALIDKLGNKHPKTRQYVSMIKVVAPQTACQVLDRAIQVFGGAGVSQDTELAHLWASARSLRIADGPDDVHKEVIGRGELAFAKL